MPERKQVPVLGQAYQGAGIVTDIEETVQDTPSKNMTWNRKVITTDQGAIFTLDHYVEKKKQQTNNPKEMEEETKITMVQKPPTNPTMSQSSAEKETTTTRTTTTTTLTRNNHSNVPLTITVYSKNDPDLPMPTPPPPGSSPSSLHSEPVRGIWTFGDGGGGGGEPNNAEDQHEEEEEDAFWKPQQVLLYRPGLETIPEEGSLPSGIWGYAEDQDPPSSSFSPGGGGTTTTTTNQNNDAEDWYPRGCALVVPPAAEAPANFVAAGRYTYKPGSLHTDWPPPVDHIKKQLHGIGKLEIPQCFEENDGKLHIKVFPKSKVPLVVASPGGGAASMTEDVPPQPSPAAAKNSVTKGVRFVPPVGQWAYPEGQEENDDHFLPVDVDLYWGDDKPASISGALSDDGSMVSWGVWGSQQGSIDLDDPEWEPEMSMVFPPGMEPDPEIAIQGRWAYRMNQNVKIEWPPKVTKTALVFSSKNAPPVEPGNSQGVWAFPAHDRNDGNEDDWEPLEVEILGEDDSLGDEGEDNDEDRTTTTARRPNGFWGIRKGAEPDRNWDWKPCDVLFFPPGVEAGDDTWIQGRWAMKRRSVGKLKNTWPPVSKSVNTARTVGKLKSVQWPKQAWVYPAQKVPPRKKDRTMGVWRFTGGTEPTEASSWKPQQVDLFRSSDKIDGTKPSGSWGVNLNATETGDSHFEPEDIWFYPPGQPAEKQCSVQGRWAFQRSKLDVAWPPPIVSPAVQARKSVGKLKIPGAFESEASPKVGRTRGSSGGDMKVPSLFSNI